eukprot:CAMPEP_0119106610 /NCGR_PEP_ID=MMETSP1180-20130426/5283_1 /TAXON_ID=3052 ORGANISM="Chlamydomonas cf sp, Strain CCMP681" /NCGR_SAMPLE_ID=MMETSP1180 /ASSEMBLY_ACC=CAM_ASM_000741 /LENGTH=81 /DNA_ID=CAMNT_0007091975 /DNA_START=17 /DNA_END=262 /DNA_ORIENTATION=+
MDTQHKHNERLDSDAAQTAHELFQAHKPHAGHTGTSPPKDKMTERKQNEADIKEALKHERQAAKEKKHEKAHASDERKTES